LKILVVDDGQAIRSGISQLLHADLDLSGLGEAASGAEAIEKLRAHSWDAVVLDISMPDGNGYDVLHWRKAEAVRVPVVMQSTDIQAATVKRCLDLDAAGFVAKNTLSEELVPAVVAVTTGQLYLCRIVLAAIGLRHLADLADHRSPHQSRLYKFVFRRLREKFQDNRTLNTDLLATSRDLLESTRSLLEVAQVSRHNRQQSAPAAWH
jgi:DNA-binding NarL/FixJ family response regulator